MTTSLLLNPIAASPSSLLYAMRRDPLEFFTTLAREHGDIVRFRLGDHEQDLFLVNHPDYIRDVLVSQSIVSRKCWAKDYS
jgi:cytochrome P450